jgi:ribonuclease R
MARRDRKPSTLPEREQILDFIRKNPHASGKREISRAFGLNVEQKRELKKMLREMQNDGTLQKGRGRKFTEAGKLPSVGVIEVIGPDEDGELIAKPLNWDEDGPAPTIYMSPERPGQPAPGKGDRLLARLTELEDGTYQGKTIRRISAAPVKAMGVIVKVEGELRVRPTDRRSKNELIVRPEDLNGAEVGDLVRVDLIPGKRLGLRHARVSERLDATSGTACSLISIHHHDIPTEFPPEALRLAEKAKATPLGKRVDLRETPLVTIDGADARDFDDAVYAEKDTDSGNDGGWRLLVAIADVSWYVRSGDALDREAHKRGNSVYFPDQVVPMLPEALSNGWCSLVPHEERPCLVAEMWVDKEGKLQRHKFYRALMRSAARLTYTQAQMAWDGHADDTTAPLIETVIAPLYGAYEALAAGREARQTLELDLPEKQIKLADDGSIRSIVERERLDSHKLIEEFMITANVAAAEALEKKRQPCMYRIHDQPSIEKLTMLSDFLDSVNLRFAKGQVVQPNQFNQILEKAKSSPEVHMINQIVLRTQAQAEYNPKNIGHFGLSLKKYCHFTSPIRRYSDLLVHRALIDGFNLGKDGLGHNEMDFVAIGEHISSTERRAAVAERDTVDRYVAQFMSAQVGATFHGRVNGVTRFGLFVTLDETGADGLIPISTLPGDFYDHDENRHCLSGRQSGREYKLGQSIEIRLVEASPITGGLIFGVMDAGNTHNSDRSRMKKKLGRPTGKKSKNRTKRGKKQKR